VEGARYIYSATTSPATATRSALDRYVRVFFQGSRSRMVTALLRQGSWTDEELEQLHAEIAEARARANSRADGLQGRKPRESS
jgi:hypothetical protein